MNMDCWVNLPCAIWEKPALTMAAAMHFNNLITKIIWRYIH